MTDLDIHRKLSLKILLTCLFSCQVRRSSMSVAQDPRKLFLLGQQISRLSEFEDEEERKLHVCGGGCEDREAEKCRTVRTLGAVTSPSLVRSPGLGCTRSARPGTARGGRRAGGRAVCPPHPAPYRPRRQG